MAGTVRTMKRDTMKLIETNMERLTTQVAAGFGAEAKLDFRLIFASMVNDRTTAALMADAAAELVGEANVDRKPPPAWARRISAS